MSKWLLVFLLAHPASAQVIRQTGVGVGSIDTPKLATDAVTTAKILNGAVDTAKLASDAVTTAKIINAAVDTAKIATDAVTAAKILSATASLSKVSGGSLVADSATSDTFVGTATVQGNAFSVGGSTLVVTGGNVGIGTTSPGSKLDVSGTTNLGGATTVAGSSLTVGGYIGTSGVANAAIRITGGGTSAGYFDVSNTGGEYAMGAEGSAGGQIIVGDTPYALALAPAGTHPFQVGYNNGNGLAMTILGTNGNVGIGTTNPNTKLHMSSGTLTIDGNVSPAVDLRYGALRYMSQTMAQLLVITPGAVGETYFCSNCSPAKIVVSTGTSAGNFADAIGGTFQ